MLAFMPRPSSLPASYTSASHLQSGISLPLLPSTPMGSSELPSFTARPKLKLNTSNVSPIFGKGSTSLRLETLSAASPTSRNTFQNRQAGLPKLTGRSEKPVLTPITTNVASPSTVSPSPSQISLPDSADTADFSASPFGSETSVSTPNSSPSEAPYKLPFNATSILSNGPIPRTKSRRLSFSQSRPMFPTPKRVLFRAPLTEEIETTKYTLRHSDIESIVSSTATSGSASSNEHVSERSEGDVLKSGNRETALNPQSGSKRDSADIESNDESTCATPVAGRAKRHRWVWTLPPVSQEDFPSVDNMVHCTPA